MGARQERLQEYLLAAGARATGGIPRCKSPSDLARAGILDEVVRTYHQLSGTASLPTLNAGAWDIQIDGHAVELDEEQHFNRYRAITLSSPVYRRLAVLNMRDYTQWCAAHEGACLRTAGTRSGFWTKPSCEREFGPSSPVGVLDGGGSSRWKQRAFYDFIKDLTPLVYGHEVRRLAVWEVVVVAGRPCALGDLLDGKRAADAPGVAASIRAHLQSPVAHSTPQTAAS